MPSGIPRTATHLVAGIEREGSLAAMRAEAFVKRYADYVVAGAGPPVIAGRARGIDLAVRRTGGRLTGLLGYSLLGATVRLADGRTVRSPLDVTHTFTATATASVGTDWSLGSTFRYGTGAPITPITGGEERDGRLVPVHGAILSDRLPAYARLDWRLMRFMRRSRFLLTTYAEVLNLAGRRNVASMWYDAEYRRRQPIHAFFARRTVVVGGELQLR
jgi:hypothetical protein